MLYFVQDYPLGQIGNKTIRVCSCTFSGDRVVEAYIGVVTVVIGQPETDASAPDGQVTPPHGQILRRIFNLGKGCLATLARAVNQYDWRVFQRLRQSALNIARNERFKHRLIVIFRFVQSKRYGSSDRNVSRWRPVKFFIDFVIRRQYRSVLNHRLLDCRTR